MIGWLKASDFLLKNGKLLDCDIAIWKTTAHAFTVMGHEVYHMVRNMAPKSAQQIERMFDRWAAGAGFDVERRIDSLIAQYARGGIALNRTAAKEEIIANSMYDVVTTPEIVRQMYVEDRTLMQRVMDWARQAQARIQDMLRSYTARTPEARMLERTAGSMEQMNRLLSEAFEEMRQLDERKASATSMKIGDMTLRARHDMTRKYTAAVNRATSSEQITDAARELAKDILRETGNEVNGKNVSRVMGAAMGVRSGEKTTPNAEMRMSGLRYDKNSPAVNEGLNLLGGLVNEIARAEDTEQYMRLFSQEEEKSGKKYSLIARDSDVTKDGEVKKGMDDQERYRVLNGKQVTTTDVYGTVNEREILSYNGKRYSDVETALVPIARELKLIPDAKGKTKGTVLRNQYLNIDAEFTKQSLHESLQKQDGNVGSLAMLLPVFEDTYKNAVPVMVRDDQYRYAKNETTNIEDFVVLLGAFKYKGKVVPVKFGLKHYGNNDNRVYIVDSGNN